MWTYPKELAAALADHGFAPHQQTPPALVREAVNDLYRYELRRLREGVQGRALDKPAYLERVVALRKQYWVLTLPLAAWERICSGDNPTS